VKCQNNSRVILFQLFISFITFPVVQKFTYTQLVFGSVAFKLFNLGQMFRVAFHKLPTISWVNFGQFSSAHKFSIGLRSGLCDGHSQYLDVVVLKPFCHNLGSMLGVIVHLEDPFATKLTDVLRCCFNIST
jgi:hypothetical protein